MRVFTCVSPYNTSPLISINISHIFQFQISHISHTSNFIYEYFLSHTLITLIPLLEMPK